jgi:NitT/TauT family transport system substrate-binding protein
MKPLELSSQVEAFKKKQVDAIVTFEPVRSQLIALGGREIFSSGQIAGEVADILITRRELIMNRKKELQKLIYGWFKALEYLKQHPLDVARRVATSREGISPDQYLKSFHGFTIPDLQENRRLLSGPTPTFRTQLRQILKVLVSFQVIKSSIDPGTYLDDQLIKASSP